MGSSTQVWISTGSVSAGSCLHVSTGSALLVWFSAVSALLVWFPTDSALQVWIPVGSMPRVWISTGSRLEEVLMTHEPFSSLFVLVARTSAHASWLLRASKLLLKLL